MRGERINRLGGQSRPSLGNVKREANPRIGGFPNDRRYKELASEVPVFVLDSGGQGSSVHRRYERGETVWQQPWAALALFIAKSRSNQIHTLFLIETIASQ